MRGDNKRAIPPLPKELGQQRGNDRTMEVPFGFIDEYQCSRFSGKHIGGDEECIAFTIRKVRYAVWSAPRFRGHDLLVVVERDFNW